jgi:hypothetical protein
MADLKEDKWYRDVVFLIIGWMIALAAAGLLLYFGGNAIFA